MKQAGLAWWRQLNASMRELGFECLKLEAKIFCYNKGTNLIVAVVYVDDTFFCGPDIAILNQIKAKFMTKWEYRDLDTLNKFLKMQIT